MVDQLHGLNMGTLNRFSQELCWQIFWDGVWISRRGLTQTEWIDSSVQGLRADLNIWMDKQERDNPSHQSTRIQELKPESFGRPGARVLKLKAAETKVFLLLPAF